MKVLIIPSWYKSKENPVLGTFFEDQARALSSAGVNVSIMYPFFSISDENFRSNNDNGITTHYIPVKIISRPLVSQIPIFVHKNLRYIEKIIVKYSEKIFEKSGLPDVIHVHSSYLGGVSGLILKRQFGIRYFITEHASFITKPTLYYFGSSNLLRICWIKWMQRKINRPQIESIFNESNGLILVSEFQKQEINRHYSIDVTQNVIGNVVNPIYFENNHEPPSEKFIILAIGNFIKLKNFKLLLNSFSKLTHFFPTAELHLIGQGPMKKKYEMMQVTNTFFLGQMNRHEVKGEMAAASLVVSTSHFETFGVSMAEAMALGKNILIPERSPLAYLIKDKMSLYKNNSAKDLFEKLNYHISKGNCYNGKNKEIAFANFSPLVIADKLIELYMTNE